ncbi:polyprenol phosphomannose-dependent alpha 1,6 mannosyltransferase MptB [Spongisporangium articulatum]|uniref:Polyprenol phosphomannose-dependent alpha 1,6 mannosyltransferase MptB n=1 Tax=Spongisporangium articulatum TaxID=3362603 RepID=A0ABW8AJF8_9ACTN
MSLRPAALCGVGSLLLVVATAAAGESAAAPGLGPHTVLPPWDAGRHPASGAVTVALVAAYALGGLAVLLGLRAVSRGARLPGRVIGVGGALAVLACVLVPPLGSADHLSYVAYGRIAAQGGDPYAVAPIGWHGGTDPVTSAVQPPWQDTPSVYGPVTTALQAVAAEAGNGNLRTTVWFWQLIAGAAFLLTAYLLDRITRPDPAARTRAALLWTVNPLLLAELVAGAHVDVLAVAFAMAALALAARQPFAAGLALGGAVGSKVTFALFGLAILWALVTRLPRRDAGRAAGLGALGALLVLVPAHLWSGSHTYGQLHRATRSISFATPWRLVADNLDGVLGADTVRSLAGPLSAGFAVLLALALGRALRGHPTGVPDEVTGAAARAGVVLALAWVLTVPYALPWYDAIAWAPLALLAPGVLDGVLLARLTVLAVAYAPGRVVGLSDDVEHWTLWFRRDVAPWLTLAVLACVVTLTVRGTPFLRADARTMREL